MKKLFFALLILLVISNVLYPQLHTTEVVEQPFYSGELTFDPAARRLSGQLHYKLPQRNYDQIVLNIYANIYEKGMDGNFVFPEFYERVFYRGDSRGDLIISNVKINGQAANFTVEDTRLVVTPKTNLRKDSLVELQMDYSMTFPLIGHRSGGNDYAVWAGNWLPLLAVQQNGEWLNYPYYPAGDPFFDQVGDFKLSFNIPSGYVLIAPGYVERTSTGFAVTAKNMREFAIAIGSGYQETIKHSRQGIELAFYTYSVSTNTVNRLLVELEDMIDYFANEVGPYPYPSLRFAQITWFLGGMEYPGVIYLSDTTFENYYSVRSTMLHELSHQWFYAVIGNNQVTDPWIDEGLATFFQNRYLYKDDVHSFYASEPHNLAYLLRAVPDRRLGQPLSVYTDWSSYHRVNYRRSALMQYELYKLMGADNYRLFTQALYSNYKFKELNKNNLVELASNVYGEDLTTWFEPWFIE